MKESWPSITFRTTVTTACPYSFTAKHLYVSAWSGITFGICNIENTPRHQTHTGEMKHLFACYIKSCAVIICVFFRPLISYGTAVNILWIIIQEKNSPDLQKKEKDFQQKSDTFWYLTHLEGDKRWQWGCRKMWRENLIGIAGTSLREVSVPFLMPHGADFQNCMF